MIRILAAALLFCSTLAHAQGHGMEEEMRKRMEEISHLMRESERLLLEITRVDRLVAKQQAIVRELEKLEPPKQNDPASAARQQKANELKKQQADAARKLGELFDGQKKRAERTVTELAQLLKNWPKDRQQGQGQPKSKSKQRKEREKRLREQKEQQQKSRPDSPRKHKQSKDERRRGKRPEDKLQASRALRAVEAWIAKLPPKQQERISRGDLSDIPSRYRRLVREYTALRAKREAEPKAPGEEK